jgi:hypothetical protein
MTINLSCFDPGKVTGHTRLLVHDNKLVEIKTLDQYQDYTKTEAYVLSSNCVVYESFHLVDANVSMAPIEMIGVIKYLCKAHGIHIKAQQPSTRNFVDRRWPDRIKAKDRKNQQLRHCIDALKHGLFYVVFNLGIDSFKLIDSTNKLEVIEEWKGI